MSEITEQPAVAGANGATAQGDVSLRERDVGQTLLLNVRQAARLLGIGKNLCYEMINEGRLPHVRLGRRVLVPREGLRAWIAHECEAQVSPDPASVVLSPPRQREEET